MIAGAGVTVSVRSMGSILKVELVEPRGTYICDWWKQLTRCRVLDALCANGRSGGLN